MKFLHDENIRPSKLCSLAATGLCLLLIGKVSAADFSNPNGIFKREHFLDLLETRIEGKLFPGTGLDFSDPTHPVSRGQIVTWSSERKQRHALEGEQPTSIGAVSGEDEQPISHLTSMKVDSIDSSTFEQRVSSVAKRYSGSAGFLGIGASAGSANQQARSVLQTQQVRMLILESPARVVEQVDRTTLQMRQAPKKNGIEETLSQFVGSHGSHYVQDMTYGYVVTIAAKAQRKDKVASDTLEKNFSADFSLGSFSAAGSAGNATASRQRLKTSKIEFRLAVEAGQLMDRTTKQPRPVTYSDFDQIVSTLKGLANGDLYIVSSPVRLSAYSLRDILDPVEYPQLVAALTPPAPKPIEAGFGVPAGTILAWRPPIGTDTAKIVPPTGWALCNGEGVGAMKTPDLTGRFLRGYESTPEREGGSESHVHWTKATKAAEKSKAPLVYPRIARQKAIALQPADNLPPFYDVVYIMKLDESNKGDERKTAR